MSKRGICFCVFIASAVLGLFGIYGFYVWFALAMILGAISFFSDCSYLREDLRNAKTLLQKHNAFFGWTNSAKVARGERPVSLFEFWIFVSGVSGLFLGFAATGSIQFPQLPDATEVSK